MDWILEVMLMVVLALVVYQDLKMRLIHIVLPVLILGLSLLLNREQLAYEDWAWSFMFLVLNLAVVFLYFSLKQRTFINPMHRLIGWGDLLFLFALIPLFSFRGYLQYFVMGMLFSLCLFLLMKWIFPKYNTVPLAGFLSLFLMGTKLIELVFDEKLLT